jgi:spore coat protein U-like protein
LVLEALNNSFLLLTLQAVLLLLLAVLLLLPTSLACIHMLGARAPSNCCMQLMTFHCCLRHSTCSKYHTDTITFKAHYGSTTDPGHAAAAANQTTRTCTPRSPICPTFSPSVTQMVRTLRSGQFFRILQHTQQQSDTLNTCYLKTQLLSAHTSCPHPPPWCTSSCCHRARGGSPAAAAFQHQTMWLLSTSTSRSQRNTLQTHLPPQPGNITIT